MTYMGKPYYPLWLDNLADDVTGEGPAWDGAIEGAQAVHEVVVAAREIYEFQDFHYAGPCAENSFLEDYSSSVRGVPRCASSCWSPSTPPARLSGSSSIIGHAARCWNCPARCSKGSPAHRSPNIGKAHLKDWA